MASEKIASATVSYLCPLAICSYPQLNTTLVWCSSTCIATQNRYEIKPTTLKEMCDHTIRLLGA